MKLLIAGSSGLIGRALKTHLNGLGHTVGALSRRGSAKEPPLWDINEGFIDLGDFGPIDAVINLAGEPIATGRWTEDKKHRILQSREESTHLLATTLAKLDPKPKTFISASAIGYYQPQGEQPLDETAPPGEGFLSTVCQRWEEATIPAINAGIRVVNARFGVVLSPKGGALKALRLPFLSGLGGPVGSGEQYFSWISLTDLVGALTFLLDADTVKGPVNLVAPEAVTNRTFSKALGRALHRPAFLPLPAAIARVLLGPEKANHMLLDSVRVIPARLQEAGYTFKDPRIEEALKRMLAG